MPTTRVGDGDGNITFQKGDAVADATGFLAYKNGLHHCARAGGTNKCLPLPVGRGDLSAGSRAGSKDSVGSTGDVPAEGASFSPGTFKWRIPWQFAAGSSTTKQFMIATHIHTSDFTGGSGTSKVNVLVYQGLNDPSPTTTIGP